MDRPDLNQIALRSVLEGSFAQKEIVAVIDGFTDANLALYSDWRKSTRTSYPVY